MVCTKISPFVRGNISTNSVAKISFPGYALEAIGVNEENRNVIIKVSKNKLTIELGENNENKSK